MQGYSGRGRPSRAAALAQREAQYDDDDAPAPKAAGRGRGAGRPRAKAAAAQRHPTARGPAKGKANHSVVSALAKGINRCDQCGIEFYQQPPFAQSSWFVFVSGFISRFLMLVQDVDRVRSSPSPP